MAVTETVKIVFDVDNKAITDTVADLVALGKVSQEDANKFKQLSDASKAASKDLAAVGNSATNIDKVAVAVKDVGDSFTPLSKQIKAAKDELQRLTEEFGAGSVQATKAAQSLAGLTKQSEDLQKNVTLLKPENKIAAFERLGSAVLGSFQIATGALQAFGAENEQVAAVAQKLQGAINVVQGIQSVVQLKDAFQDVKAVLGFTTVAQQTLTTATTTGTIATQGAAAATRGFAAALSSTGIGAIVVLLGVLAGAMLLSADSTDEDTEAQEKNNAERAKAIDELNEEVDLLLLKREAQGEGVGPAKRELELLKARGVQGKQLFDAEQKARQKELEALLFRRGFLGDDFKNEAERLKLNEQIADKRNEITAAEIEFQREQREKGVRQAKESEEQKLKDLEDAQKRREEIVANQLSLQRQFEQELNSQVGDIDRDLALEKLQNQVQFFGDQNALRKADTQSEISSIDRKLEKLKEFGKEGTDEYKTLTLKRELLVKEGADAEAKAVQDAEKKKQEAAEKTYNQYKELGDKQKKIDEEKRQAQLDTLQFTIEQSQEIADFVGEQGQRETEEKIARLEREREAGLISEEVYQSKLRKIKQKGAEETKKLQVFQATMNVAQAILSALSATYSDPTAKVRAVAFASIAGAINLAKILATPVPKFKDGTLSVPGQDMGRDSVYAMLRPGEAVIPTETNRMYAPTIEAIYKKRVKASEINDFVMNSSSMTSKTGSTTEINRTYATTIEAIYKKRVKASEINAFVLNRMSGKGGIGRDTAITASVDTFALGRVMSKQKTVEVGNANIVGKAIAGEIMKAYNPRRS